jgi:hypothetical protein
MKSGTKLIFAGAMLMLCVAASRAEEKFGVRVYEGAKLEKDVSDWVSESFSAQAFCYHTSDSPDKVIAFYKNEPGLKFIGEAKGNAMLKKGDVDITIQSPWQNVKTGQLFKDTLITILKNKSSDSDEE